MTEPKRPRGRPAGTAQFTIQKKFLMDRPTVEKLAQLAREAEQSESAVVRKLIQDRPLP